MNSLSKSVVNLMLPLLLLLASTVASAADRVAWVIGNERYKDAPLKNPVNDANAISAALKKIGFEVKVTKNASLSSVHSYLDTFGKKAKKAKVAVIYFAGHGVQINDKNYLIPTNFALKSGADLRLRKLVSLDSFMVEASQASRLGVVMVDACRDNPFQEVFKLQLESLSEDDDKDTGTNATTIQILQSKTPTTRGLARVTEKPTEASRRILVSLATEQGDVALDGSGKHSPYAKAILENIDSTQDIRKILSRVKQSVIADTGGRQTPYLYTTLDKRNYCLTAKCEDGSNGIDSDRMSQKYTNSELIQMEQQKRLKAKQERDKQRLAHERKLMDAKNEQIKKHRAHQRKLKLKQLKENKKRQQRMASLARKKQQQLDKNRKRAWELEKQRKLRAQQLKLGITPTTEKK